MSGIMSMLLGAASSAIKDAYFNLTTLLLNTSSTNGAQNNTFLDSSTNNFTITRNGNTTQGTFTPFSQTGWSNYFNGTVTTSYLNAVSNAVFDFGTGDFTLEAFIYVPAYPTSGTVAGIIIAAHNWNGSGMNFIFRIGQTGLLYFENSAGNSLTASTAVALNTWAHVACVRSSGTVTFYINGTSAGSGAAAGSISSTTAVSIGNALSGGTFGNFNGYISNARITKGGALYTSTFTPSTTPLTTTVSAGTVSLLTCQSNRYVDNSVNNFTLTSGTTNSVQAFSPFLPTAAYDTAVVGGSGYFDGSGDYLSLASNTALTPASSTYTFECWVYRTTSGAMTIWDTSVTNGFYVHINGSNKIVLRAYGTADIITSSLNAPVNSWFHVAVARGAANSTKMWINGSSTDGGSATDSTTYAAATTYIGIYDVSTVPLTGYIAGMRLVKGSDVYGVSNSTITVPTAPPTAITNTQFLANFTNSGIFDSTAKNVLETVGNAQVSTTQAKWGTTSMAFDGTGDWLFLNSSAASANTLALGGGDFTVEMWLYPNSSYSGSFAGIMDSRTTGDGAGLVYFGYTSTANQIGWKDNTTNVVTGTVTQSAWNHVAVVRDSGTLKLYINGSLASSGSNSTNYTAPFKYIGSSFDPLAFNGYMDDLRITRGYARYSGSTYTQPAAAFPLQ
jgi:hypothetical protein